MAELDLMCDMRISSVRSFPMEWSHFKMKVSVACGLYGDILLFSFKCDRSSGPLNLWTLSVGAT